MSCVGKAFSGIINKVKRVVNYCEDNNIYEDEQNGFRKKRSCEDHIFVLTSIIRNRISENKDTFCSFKDMQKAFDWINRDMLLYRMLDYNIDGNIYNCIKALCRHPLTCIKINGYISKWFDIVVYGRETHCPLHYLVCILMI